MEGIEFLGGKYNKPEQVVPGPVETFRAQNASTGRPVYIHRVSTTGEQVPEQAALLRLLMTALFRSPSAHRLVLDFGDEKGYWYVVTECEPQCLLLREWLQFEIDNVPAGSAAPPSPAAKAPDSPQKPPSEFTRMFQTVPATPPAPPRDGPSRPEPGEFTRFFREGLPAAAPKQSAPPTPRPPDRPSNPDLRRPGAVQRPNTPVPPIAPRPSDPGEFTRMFAAHPPPAAPPAAPRDFGFNNPRLGEAPDLGKPKPEADDIFNLSPEAPAPLRSPSQEPGEYTRLFGKNDAPPPIQKPSTVAAPPATPMVADSLKSTRPLPLASSTPAAPPAPVVPPPAPSFVKDPSEFTRIMQGNRVQVPPPANAPPQPAESIKLNIPPASAPPISKPQLPPISMQLPQAAPAVPNDKKLLIFFGILGVLALLLVLLIVVLATKK